MKSRKHLWIASLSLLSAVVLAAAFTSRTSIVHADRHSVPAHQASIAQPATYLASPSLRAVLGSDAMLLNSVDAQRVAATLSANPLLPYAEEFTLTPPDPAQKGDKTALSVRFTEAEAEGLAEQIPMNLGGQRVLLQRSAEEPSTFSTYIDFDWTAFLAMQQHRKILAQQNKTISIYKGRDFIRQEVVPFVDPASIRLALQKHQSIQFNPEVLLGTMLTVVPDHELTVINTSVVEDTENGNGRTYDACLQNQGQNPGNPNGAWTFQTLWMAAIHTSSVQVAEQALDDFLTTWQNTQPINGFSVSSRTGIGTLGGTSGLLSNWPTTGDTCYEGGVGGPCPSLEGPVRLNAIVNRIDLGGQPGQNAAGELRFVFGVTAGVTQGDKCSTAGPPAGSPPPFNIILEYHVPTTYTASQWASQWDMLPKTGFGTCDTCYIPQLQLLITNNVVNSTSCAGNSCLFHIRTNELLLADNPGTSTAIWELREFGINLVSGGPNTISEIAVDQTPDNSFNFGGGPCRRSYQGADGQPYCNTTDADAMADYINPRQLSIVVAKGIQPLIPTTFNSEPFQGGSSLNGFQPGTNLAGTYWNNCASIEIDGATCTTQFSGPQALEARRYLSLNTCNGCHGEETSVNSGFFQQVFNRLPNDTSNLSNFLLGCVPSSGSCGSGNAGNDSCQIGGTNQCSLNTPGQESVEDKVALNYHSYGDIVARQSSMSTLGPVNEVFLPFIRPRLGVH